MHEVYNVYKSVLTMTCWQITTYSPVLFRRKDMWKIEKVQDRVKRNPKELDFQLSTPIQMENKAVDFVPRVMNYKVGPFLISKIQEG